MVSRAPISIWVDEDDDDDNFRYVVRMAFAN